MPDDNSSALRDNTATVYFPTGTFKLTDGHSVEVISEQGNHEIAILTYGYPVSDAVVPPEQTPVYITYGRGPVGVRTFFGYVNHVEDDQDRAASTTRIFCIGTSVDMNNHNPQAWADVSATYIATQIAARYRLRPILTRTFEVIPSWAQGNESDFAMLNRLAARSGCRFWVSGASLYFLDPSTLLSQSSATFVQQLTMDGNIDDTLLSLGAVTGSLAPGIHSARNVVAYTLQVNNPLPDGGANLGAVIKTTSTVASKRRGRTPGSLTRVLQKVAQAPAESQSLTNAAANIGDWSQCQVAVNTAAPIKVGDSVNLRGAQLSANRSGLWQVTGVSDKFVFGSEITLRTNLLTLTRNQSDTHVYTQVGGFKGVIPEAPCSLINDRWVTSQSGRVFVA